MPCGMNNKEPSLFGDGQMIGLASMRLSDLYDAAPAAPGSHRRVPVRREPGEPGTHMSLG
ncbi:extracellular serine carboxypeptidase [Streptomyces laurentii]|uniref:Extracellular serine carboxypeptidase n=1 Tax=Streptomyces laurentii TaxID=39478 RepID=A0A160P5Q7_STRLU|nr:extracellular serine carboxypeptidase [Streptomyces laurentii]